MRFITRGLGGFFLVMIRAYQLLIAPILPGSCRFTPSCSRYAAQAFRRHPPHRALWLSIRRIVRCHPLHPGGEDPVP
ncbi:MAG: membrane protein insertion efficiency factor YidD [bacterium]